MIAGRHSQPAIRIAIENGAHDGHDIGFHFYLILSVLYPPLLDGDVTVIDVCYYDILLLGQCCVRLHCVCMGWNVYIFEAKQ